MVFGKSFTRRVIDSCKLKSLPSAVRTTVHREYLTSPDTGNATIGGGFLSCFLGGGNNTLARFPNFLSFSETEKLREKFNQINFPGDHLERVSLPTTDGDSVIRISVADTKKLLKLAQLEKVKKNLKRIPTDHVSYAEFVRICVDECGNETLGLEFAKLLDQSHNVIVMGNIVFIRPSEVVQSVKETIREALKIPNDPRKKELEELEAQKAIIDKKAEAQVRTELYCGLGFLAAQTFGFMRLTFWELSWDVMEPICFFTTSIYFGVAYIFFLRTSTEPTFEGYFRRRFKAKQAKLMKMENFDVQKYNQLCKMFYPYEGRYALAENEVDE